jgi:hypothetical protein
MFVALLIEGKEPPVIEEQGAAVMVTLLASELSAPFRDRYHYRRPYLPAQ